MTMINILTNLGYKKNISHIIILLLEKRSLELKEIEKILDLKQSEVSIAIKELCKRDLVERHIKDSKIGRPRQIVTIKDDAIYKISCEITDKILDFSKTLNDISSYE